MILLPFLYNLAGYNTKLKILMLSKQNKNHTLQHRFLTLSAIVVLFSLLFLSPVQAQIYKHIDENGVTVFSNIKPRVKNYEVIRLKCKGCGWKKKVDWSSVNLNLDDFTSEILDACEKHAVDEAFVRAIIHAESWFDVKAVSDVGAQGLMQLMPATQKRFGVNEAFSPEDNIKGGVEYLRVLLDMFDNDTALVSAAYNAGENAVLRYKGVPPFEQTENFVKRVKILTRRYQKALG